MSTPQKSTLKSSALPAVKIFGRSGKLGSLIEELNKEFDLVDNPLDADLILDVSHPNNLSLVLECNKPTVIGTTGYSAEQIQRIHCAADKIPLFFSPNFSLGIAAMVEALPLFSPMAEEISISETHPATKRDSPSGTALLLKHTLKTKAPITSIREGEDLFLHEVTLQNAFESVTIVHRTTSRSPFAKGALKALSFLIGKRAGLYTMKDLLYEKNCRREFSHR